MARSKPLVVVENPYGGVIPQLLQRLDRGEAYDMARLLSYEAAAMGANMTLPYGSWMGSEIEDAFSLPEDLALEIQSFLKQVDPLLSSTSANKVAVVFDVASNARFTFRREVFADNRVNNTIEDVVAPFWALTAELGRHGVPFDVVVVNDDVVPASRLTAGDLGRYDLVVVPGDDPLPEWASATLRSYVGAGGSVVATAQDSAWRAPSAAVVSRARAVSPAHVECGTPVGVNTHRLDGGGIAVHVVNYDLDHDSGQTRPLRDLKVHVPARPGVTVGVVRPLGPRLELRTKQVGDSVVLPLPVVRTYAVIELPATS
jgi:hypothetical protein